MWWQYIIIVAVIAVGIYGFVVLVRYMTKQMTRKTDRRAEDMYEAGWPNGTVINVTQHE